MSKLWDDLKENMKDWSVSAVEKAEEMSKIAMAKTEEMTRISKIRFEIHQLQREINNIYQELGRLAYSHTKKDHMATFSGNNDFFQLVNNIERIKEKILVKENDIDEIKSEYGIENDLDEKNHLNNQIITDEVSVKKDNLYRNIEEKLDK